MSTRTSHTCTTGPGTSFSRPWKNRWVGFGNFYFLVWLVVFCFNILNIKKSILCTAINMRDIYRSISLFSEN